MSPTQEYFNDLYANNEFIRSLYPKYDLDFGEARILQLLTTRLQYGMTVIEAAPQYEVSLYALRCALSKAIDADKLPSSATRTYYLLPWECDYLKREIQTSLIQLRKASAERMRNIGLTTQAKRRATVKAKKEAKRSFWHKLLDRPSGENHE